MPLPELPANNTARYFLDYTTGRYEHTLTCRYTSGQDGDAVRGRIFTFLDAIKSALPTAWQPLRARAQAAGSLVSVPADLGVLATFAGTSGTPLEQREEPREFRWVGRSLGGRRVSVSLYGLLIATPGDFRYEGAALPATLAAARAALIGSAPGIFVAIDDTNPLWYNYVNVNYNSYWEGEARGA